MSNEIGSLRMFWRRLTNSGGPEEKGRFVSDSFEAVARYLNEKDPIAAFLISGEWGAGKSHFLRTHVPKWQQETKKKIVVVSVAGLSTREELEEATFLASAPWLLDGYIQAASVFVRAGMRFAKIERKDFNLKANLKSGEVAIALEDVDRFVGDLRTFFGFVIDLIDQSRVHTILVAAEDRLLDVPHFSEWKEKILGSELLIEPATSTMLDDFIKEIPSNLARERLSLQRDSLQSVIDEWGLKNLRALRFALRQLAVLIDGVGVDIRRLKAGEKVLLSGIFLGSLEIRRNAASASAVRKVFSHQGLSENAQALLAGAAEKADVDSEESKFIAGLIARYPSFDFSLFPGNDAFLAFFKTGTVVADAVLNAFRPSSNAESQREKFLRDYLALSQEEFDHEYQSLLHDLKAHRVFEMSVLARAYLSLRHLSQRRAIQESAGEIKTIVLDAIEGVAPEMVADSNQGDDFWYFTGSDEDVAEIESAIKHKRGQAIDHQTRVERGAVFQNRYQDLARSLQEWRTRPLFLSDVQTMLDWVLGLSSADIQELVRLFGSRARFSNFRTRLADEKESLRQMSDVLDSSIDAHGGKLSVRDSQLLQLTKTMRAFSEQLEAN